MGRESGRGRPRGRCRGREGRERRALCTHALGIHLRLISASIQRSSFWAKRTRITPLRPRATVSSRAGTVEACVHTSCFRVAMRFLQLSRTATPWTRAPLVYLRGPSASLSLCWLVATCSTRAAFLAHDLECRSCVLSKFHSAWVRVSIRLVIGACPAGGSARAGSGVRFGPR